MCWQRCATASVLDEQVCPASYLFVNLSSHAFATACCCYDDHDDDDDDEYDYDQYCTSAADANKQTGHLCVILFPAS